MRGPTAIVRGPVATTRSGCHYRVVLPSNTNKCWTRTPDTANPATATVARSSSVHGNSLASAVPTTHYRRVTSGGEFQKWGISGNYKGRYTSTELGTDQLIRMTSGTRSAMANLERWLVRNDPGPMNHEPWAGKG